MKAKPLIVFEGMDNSGKTTLSQRIAKEFPYAVWSKEPTFSTQIADELNSPQCKDEYDRETLSLEGRLERQTFYSDNFVFLDRYLWSGMAYSKVFSPGVYNFVTRLYQNYRIFKKPTVTIYMDTPIELCQKREPTLTIKRLTAIRDAYDETRKYVNTPIITMHGTGDLDSNVAELKEKLSVYIK